MWAEVDNKMVYMSRNGVLQALLMKIDHDVQKLALQIIISALEKCSGFTISHFLHY